MKGDRVVIGEEEFGSGREHEDLIPPLGLLGFDLGSAAIGGGIGHGAASLVAAAFVGRDAAVASLSDSRQMFTDGVDSVRWLAIRRRCYTGFADNWVVDSAWWWAEQGDRLVAGQVDKDLLWELSDARIFEEKIDESLYRPYEPD